MLLLLGKCSCFVRRSEADACGLRSQHSLFQHAHAEAKLQMADLSTQLLEGCEEVFPVGLGKRPSLPARGKRRLAGSRWVGTEAEGFLPGAEG